MASYHDEQQSSSQEQPAAQGNSSVQPQPSSDDSLHDPPKTTLVGLPRELQLHIADSLFPVDLSALAFTCRHLHNLLWSEMSRLRDVARQYHTASFRPEAAVTRSAAWNSEERLRDLLQCPWNLQLVRAVEIDMGDYIRSLPGFPPLPDDQYFNPRPIFARFLDAVNEDDEVRPRPLNSLNLKMILEMSGLLPLRQTQWHEYATAAKQDILSSTGMHRLDPLYALLRAMTRVKHAHFGSEINTIMWDPLDPTFEPPFSPMKFRADEAKSMFPNLELVSVGDLLMGRRLNLDNSCLLQFKPTVREFRGWVIEAFESDLEALLERPSPHKIVRLQDYNASRNSWPALKLLLSDLKGFERLDLELTISTPRDIQSHEGVFECLLAAGKHSLQSLSFTLNDRLALNWSSRTTKIAILAEPSTLRPFKNLKHVELDMQILLGMNKWMIQGGRASPIDDIMPSSLETLFIRAQRHNLKEHKKRFKKFAHVLTLMFRPLFSPAREEASRQWIPLRRLWKIVLGLPIKLPKVQDSFLDLIWYLRVAGFKVCCIDTEQTAYFDGTRMPLWEEGLEASSPAALRIENSAWEAH